MGPRQGDCPIDDARTPIEMTHFGSIIWSTDLDLEFAVEGLKALSMRTQPQIPSAGGPFGPEQPCPEGTTPADRLAAFLGRSVI